MAEAVAEVVVGGVGGVVAEGDIVVGGVAEDIGFIPDKRDAICTLRTLCVRAGAGYVPWRGF